MKNKQYSQLNNLFDFLEQNRLFNGVLLLADEGQVLYQRAIGKRTLEEQHSIDSVLDIASLSKSFTATAIMLLIEENKLRLEDKLTSFFPYLPYEEVTIHHLLNHTSGLPDYMEWFEDEDEENWDPNQIATNADVVNFLKNEKPDVLFNCGEQWDYCNTGYVLLAQIIEMVSGQEYGQFLDERIFAPLHMLHTSASSQFLENKLENFASGFMYDWEKDIYYPAVEVEEHKYAYFLDGVKGDGGIKSTVSDMLKWEQSFSNHRLLSKKAYESMITPTIIKSNVTAGYCDSLHEHFGSYGLGWMVENHPKYKRIVLHDGYWAGNRSILIGYKDSNKTIILLSNLDFMDEKLNRVPHLMTLALETILHDGNADLDAFQKLIN